MPRAIEVNTKIDTRRLNNILRNLGANTDKALRQMTFKMQQEAVTMMGEPKHGRLYDDHQASAPGEAPAIDTGALANSIYVATPTQN